MCPSFLLFARLLLCAYIVALVCLFTLKISTNQVRLRALCDRRLQSVLDAVVLECTDLSAFVEVVRREAGCPVYDIVPALELILRSAARRQQSAPDPLVTG